MIRDILCLEGIVGSLDPFNEEERLPEEYRGAYYLLAKRGILENDPVYLGQSQKWVPLSASICR